MGMNNLGYANAIYPRIPKEDIYAINNTSDGVWYTITNVTSGRGILSYLVLSHHNGNEFNFKITVDGTAYDFTPCITNTSFAGTYRSTNMNGQGCRELHLNLYFYKSLKIEIQSIGSAFGTFPDFGGKAVYSLE